MDEKGDITVKRKLWIIGLILMVMTIFWSCEKSISKDETTTGDDKVITESSEEKSSKDESNKVQEKEKENKVDEKELTKSYGIFYSTEGENPDILILDAVLNDKKVILGDEARVFFSDKVMNTLVQLEIREQDQKIFIEKAELVEKASLKAKYNGFSDGNYAEFQIGKKGFVIEIPYEMVDKLKETKMHELLSLTIKPNEIKQGNPVLVDYK